MTAASSPDNDLAQARLHVVVFSKDRACQLDSLLRSIRDKFSYPVESLSILYCSSSEDFRKGFVRLEKRAIIPGVRWHLQADFKPDLFGIIANLPKTDLIMFLVDDDIFFRTVDLNPVIRSFTKRHLFISLRNCRGYGHHDPDFIRASDFLEWRWYARTSHGIWRYPFSVDGNIFHVNDICRMVKAKPFSAPNSFESALHSQRHRPTMLFLRPKALCPIMPALFNNPLNKVQTEGETWHAGISPQELNQRYLNSEQIDNSKYYSYVPHAEHDAVQLNFQQAE